MSTASPLIGNYVKCIRTFVIKDILNGVDITIEKGRHLTIEKLLIDDKYTGPVIIFSETPDHVMFPLEVLEFFECGNTVKSIKEFFSEEEKDQMSNRKLNL